ncbi:ComEC/Rec2 family competence protein [Actinotalea sp. Marseille-Q4924]|uniref:ComEC/Rec2 family competence protein n=1 Tax=Actinotalea sp. Marseille-Q4924 TaxID=2866571 RepID=UPI001CE44122|nr:ComEC/Rec2 family competence protein [Actinotalea sp. Marseille-Q4924]
MTVVQGSDLRLVPAALLTWAACFVAVGLDARGALAVAAVLAGTGAVVATALRRAVGARVGADHVGVTVALACAAAALACAVTSVQVAVREAGPLVALADEQAHATVTGRVVGDPVPVGRWGERYRVRLRVGHVHAPHLSGGSAAVVVVTGGPGWDGARHGSTVRADGRLARVPRGGEAVADLHATGPPGTTEPAGGGAAVVETFRRDLRHVTADLPPDHRALVRGSAVGATQDLPDDLRQAMRDAGLTHVTAVSGAHFAVLAVTVLGLLGVLRAPPVARAAVLAATALAFVHLVHGGASVTRAAAAAAAWVLAPVLRRPSRAVPALAAGATVLLLVDPWLSRSYGFVLSVAATAAIVLLAPALVSRRPAGVPRSAATLVAVPLAAQLACAPVLVLLDPVVTTYAVPANVLAAPALLPATLLGLLATVLAPSLPEVAEVVARLAAVPAAWVGVVARTAAGLPGARLRWVPGWPGAAALALVVTVAVTVLLRQRRPVDR